MNTIRIVIDRLEERYIYIFFVRYEEVSWTKVQVIDLVFEVNLKTMKMILAVVVCSALLFPISASVNVRVPEISSNKDVTTKEEYLQKGFDWIGDKFLAVLETFIPDERTERSNVEGTNIFIICCCVFLKNVAFI